MATTVSVSGQQLLVNCSPFIVKGTNYGPGPISSIAINSGIMWATDYDLDDYDFGVMQSMGLNAIRVYFSYSDFFNTDGSLGNPAARYNYTRIMQDAYNHGIYVIANFWLPYNTDYTISSNVTTEETQWTAIINLWKNNPDILMWVLGNEQDFPSDYQAGSFQTETQLFDLFQTMVSYEKTNADTSHPYCVSLGQNGSPLDIENTSLTGLAPKVDIWGLNYYQAFASTWNSFFSSYPSGQQPMMFTEYGNDAFDTTNTGTNPPTGVEDDAAQSTFYSNIWPAIGANLSALNSSDVCVGANFFEWADEWWKCGDTAPYSNTTQGNCGGSGSMLPDNYGNNDWFGISTELLPGVNGPRTFRAAFNTLKNFWTNSPYNVAVAGACGVNPTPTPYFTYTPTAVPNSCVTVVSNFDNGSTTNSLGGVWGAYINNGGGGFNTVSPGYNGYGLSWSYEINTYGVLYCPLSPTANSNGAGTGTLDISGASEITFEAADTLASSIYYVEIASTQTQGGGNNSWWYAPITLTNTGWTKITLPLNTATFLNPGGTQTGTFVANLQNATAIDFAPQTTGTADELFLDDIEFIGPGCFTNTPTNTATATSTNTPTHTATNTATQTPTNTGTNTGTATPTNTGTNTPTNTPTNTGTSTTTNTPTRTASQTPTNTPTNTATNTPLVTGTFTNTPTNTATATSTNTPTYTATNTATQTPTNTGTGTTTNTPTNTATTTATQTPTNTATNTITGTIPATNTCTNTSTNTATSTATDTPTNTPTETSTNTVTVTATNTVTDTVTNTATSTSTSTVTNTSTITAANTETITATNTGTSTATNTATNTLVNTATCTMTSTNTATNTPTSTLTSQATSTFTYTPTDTPTVPAQPVIFAAFPNPSAGSPISFPVEVPGPSSVTMDVFTLAFRKITSQTTQVASSSTLQWDLKDVTGIQVANGLYYVRIRITGAQSTMKILKVLILR